MHDSDSTRYNDHIEEWHSKLKKVVGKAHPNVFEIVEIFKGEQAVTEVTLSQLSSGAPRARAPTRARETIAKGKTIAELKQIWEQHQLGITFKHFRDLFFLLFIVLLSSLFI